MPNRAQRREGGSLSEVARRAAEMDERCQKQISNQVATINRLQKIIEDAKREQNQLTGTVILMIRAAGGAINVTRQLAEENDHDTIVRRDDEETGDVIFSTSKGHPEGSRPAEEPHDVPQ